MNRMKKVLALVAGLGLVAILGTSCATGTASADATHYTPQGRDFSIAAVPLLVHEQASQYDFLKKAFASKGLLDGKEVWGFSQSSLVVYQWDAVDVTLVNPGNDPHTFTITELNVNVPMPAQTQTSAKFVAMKVGTFKFFCAEAEHSPYMAGTITVLPDSAAS